MSMHIALSSLINASINEGESIPAYLNRLGRYRTRLQECDFAMDDGMFNTCIYVDQPPT